MNSWLRLGLAVFVATGISFPSVHACPMREASACVTAPAAAEEMPCHSSAPRKSDDCAGMVCCLQQSVDRTSVARPATEPSAALWLAAFSPSSEATNPMFIERMRLSRGPPVRSSLSKRPPSLRGPPSLA